MGTRVARVGSTTAFGGRHPCSCAADHGSPLRVAITGGPGAGKTALIEAASRIFCEHVAFLPEAATIVFGGGFPRYGDLPSRVASQRAIYFIQRELEGLAASNNGFCLVVCDRGTVDGAAYWPGDCRDLWDGVGTEHAVEIQRYDAVIHMETPRSQLEYEGRLGERIESGAEALAIDRRISEVWADHPQVLRIASNSDFMEKVEQGIRKLSLFAPTCCDSQRHAV